MGARTSEEPHWIRIPRIPGQADELRRRATSSSTSTTSDKNPRYSGSEELLLRNPAVVRTPLAAGDAASLCQAFRRHPRWALVDAADVMDRVWAAAALRGGGMIE